MKGKNYVKKINNENNDFVEMDGEILFAKWLVFQAGRLGELNELLDAGKYDEANKLLDDVMKHYSTVD